LNTLFLSAQQTIKVRKQTEIAFYQQGTKRESIDAKNGNLFYLHVPKEQQSKVHIHIDNGQLIALNDTLFKLRFVRGVKYECAYVLPEEKTEEQKEKREYKVMINGSSDFDKDKIRIRFVDEEKKETLLENIFIYKE
jgi:hypothetical protein